MKKIFIMAFSLCVVLLPLLADAQDGPDGFRGLSWGTPLEQVKAQMLYNSTDPSYGGIKKYTRKGDKNKIGKSDIIQILYGFWQNKLSFVSIKTSGYSNFIGLKDAAEIKYGNFFQPNQFMKKFLLNGDTGRILCIYDNISKVGGIKMWSRSIVDEQKAFDREQAQKGSSGF